MPVPEALEWAAAGGAPEVFITAHDALFTQAWLRPGSGCSSTAARGESVPAAIQLGGPRRAGHRHGARPGAARRGWRSWAPM